jgi:hypothetical protein
MIVRSPVAHMAIGLCLALAATGCSDTSPPALPLPTVAPLDFTPIDVLLAQPSSARVSTAGYVLVSTAGAELVDSISFSAGATPQPLAPVEKRIWLGADTPPALAGALHSAGTLRYAIVAAHGRLEGPGTYGPGGYRYQMVAPDLQPLSPQETTIAALLDSSALYENRPVRLIGALLARPDSALLIERLGAGGLPAPKARQVKLRASIQDQALLARLQGPPSGAIRYGQVQVEGIWHAGVLTPLSIAIVT